MFDILLTLAATTLGALAGWLIGGYGTMALMALIGVVGGMESGPSGLAYVGGLFGAVVGGAMGFSRARRALQSRDG